MIDFEVFDKKGWNVKTRMEQMQFEISNKEIEKHCWKVRGGFEEAMKNYCTLKELGYKFEEYE